VLLTLLLVIVAVPVNVAPILARMF